ncbi:MAG: hypothetical protein U0003_04010 [Vampirovibrionales bacterium]
MRLINILLTLLIYIFGASLYGAPSWAFIPLDPPGINQALRYGLEHGRFGLADVLGPNWIEKPDGTLLNIYSPFMMLATKVAKGRHPANESLTAIKKHYKRDIEKLTSPYYPVEVKFSLSSFGNDAKFARRLKARIEGVGRGKQFKLYPTKTIAPPFATALPSNNEGPLEYEAVTAFYFAAAPLNQLETFTLTIEEVSPTANSKKSSKENVTPTTELLREPLVFHLKRDRLY